MTGLPQNVEDLLTRLADNSRNELSLVRTLADAIRRADEQLLRELRGMTLQHELRRETIVGELHTLAKQLCALPAKPLPAIAPRPAIEQHAVVTKHVAEEIVGANGHASPVNSGGADWRQAAQNIQDGLDFAYGAPPRH